LIRNCAVDFVEIGNVYVRKMIIKAVKRIFNSDKICHSYSDLNFGVTFLEYSIYIKCGKVSIRKYVMLGVASSVANYVIMRMTS